MTSRFALLLLLLLSVGSGCANRPEQANPWSGLTTVTQGSAREEYPGEAIAASALVFSPPVSSNDEPLYLDRASRQPSAFFGYDDGSTEYYSLTVDDRQILYGGSGGWGHGGGGSSFWGGGSGLNDRYERDAVSVRTGVIRR